MKKIGIVLAYVGFLTIAYSPIHAVLTQVEKSRLVNLLRQAPSVDPSDFSQQLAFLDWNKNVLNLIKKAPSALQAQYQAQYRNALSSARLFLLAADPALFSYSTDAILEKIRQLLAAQRQPLITQQPTITPPPIERPLPSLPPTVPTSVQQAVPSQEPLPDGYAPQQEILPETLVTTPAAAIPTTTQPQEPEEEDEEEYFEVEELPEKVSTPPAVIPPTAPLPKEEEEPVIAEQPVIQPSPPQVATPPSFIPPPPPLPPVGRPSRWQEKQEEVVEEPSIPPTPPTPPRSASPEQEALRAAAAARRQAIGEEDEDEDNGNDLSGSMFGAAPSKTYDQQLQERLQQAGLEEFYHRVKTLNPSIEVLNEIIKNAQQERVSRGYRGYEIIQLNPQESKIKFEELLQQKERPIPSVIPIKEPIDIMQQMQEAIQRMQQQQTPTPKEEEWGSGSFSAPSPSTSQQITTEQQNHISQLQQTAIEAFQYVNSLSESNKLSLRQNKSQILGKSEYFIQKMLSQLKSILGNTENANPNQLATALDPMMNNLEQFLTNLNSFLTSLNNFKVMLGLTPQDKELFRTMSVFIEEIIKNQLLLLERVSPATPPLWHSDTHMKLQNTRDLLNNIIK